MSQRNRLMTELGIHSSDPVERFWENPCADALQALGKAKQTEEMVLAAIENDSRCEPSLEYRPILKYVSKRKLTREICLAACRKSGWNIKQTPEVYLDEEMCLAAVKSTPQALAVVPERFVTVEICRLSVENDATGAALGHVPVAILEGPYGQELCESAVRTAPKAVSHVPNKYLTKEMMLSAVERDAMAISYLPKNKISLELASIAIEGTQPTYTFTDSHGAEQIRTSEDWPIAHIPEAKITRQMAERSLELAPRSVKAVPGEFLTERTCLSIVAADPGAYGYLPESLRSSRTIIKAAVLAAPDNVYDVPMPGLRKPSCTDFAEYDAYVRAREIYRKKREKFEADLLLKIAKVKPAQEARVFNYTTKALAIPAPKSTTLVAQQDTDRAIVHETAGVNEQGVETIYYISDIHLCHQLNLQGKTICECQALVDKKVKHLIDSLKGDSGTIIVAGDVADSIEVARLFYRSLINQMESKGCVLGNGWRIFAILGNHELWNGDPLGAKPAEPLDDIVEAYREMCLREGVTLLQNDLVIDYKRSTTKQIDESMLLAANENELREVLAGCTLILLGGIGFSGLDPRFNAAMGLYGMNPPNPAGMPIPRLSAEEDAEQSRRFRALHDKLLHSAADKQVIIVSHTPMSNWSNDPYNPNWVYISGHTHQNSLILQEDGPTVLSDNQVGYKPRPWHFNAFTHHGRYNPFAGWSDGIFDISEEQYVDFNKGQGIAMNKFGWTGQIRMVKHDGSYMFFLQQAHLLILAGGQRCTATHSIEYYYENLPLYRQSVEAAFRPYHTALEALSEEIRAFGGTGTIHGCIVDIDWGNHVYLNPFDGKVTPYFALDMTNKIAFSDVPSLLAQSPYPPKMPSGKSMKKAYKLAEKKGELAILQTLGRADEIALATIPEVVLDRDMYKPSRIMRSIQYIFDQDVVRIWNDEICCPEAPQDKSLPEADVQESEFPIDLGPVPLPEQENHKSDERRISRIGSLWQRKRR